MKAAFAFLLLLPALVGSRVQAVPIEVTGCYQSIDANAILVSDLNCDSGPFESVAIEIVASNLTLDLGGHTMSGHPGGIGVRVNGFQNITVRNGTVLNFAVGMDIHQSEQVLVEHMTIKNLVEQNPDIFLPGIRMTRSTGVIVRNSLFEMLWVSHKEMIVMASSEATITNNEFTNGSVGINVSGDSGIGNLGSTVTISNNRFVGAEIACILIQFSNDTQIVSNEFDHCEAGVVADLHGSHWITGIAIEENYIHDGFLGIKFYAANDSHIRNNHIRNTWRGVFLDANMECADGPPCHYATGNTITGNRVYGNITDLFHHELALGNTWEHNFCRSKEGSEIPECTGIHVDGFETP